MTVWNTWRARLVNLTNPAARLAQWAKDLPEDLKQPQAPLTATSIAARDIVDWDYWASHYRSSHHEVKGWAQGSDQRYRSTQVAIPALEQWVHTEKVPWIGDIQAVQAMTASKSPLESYATMEEFAQARCPDWIQNPSASQVNALMDWHEIRPKDGLSMAAWDGRLVLNNSGGSHHFAAAREQARLLGQEVPLLTDLTIKRLNPKAVQSLLGAYDVIAIPKDAQHSNRFFDNMEKMGATFYTLPMPFPHQNLQAILFPKTEIASRLAANSLRQAGLWDVGVTCQELAAGQHRHARAHDGYNPAPAPSPILAHAPAAARPRPSLS